MNRLIIDNLDRCNDISLALERSRTAVISFLETRKLNWNNRVTVDWEDSNSAMVYSKGKASDSIAYVWKEVR